MTQPIDLFQSVIERLKTAVEKMNKESSLDGLLTSYFCSYYHPKNDLGWMTYCDPSDWIKDQDREFDQTPNLAVLGCLLYEEYSKETHIAEKPATIFTSNLLRLMQRKNIFQFPASWIHQPSIVLGIALGVKVTQHDQLKKWLLDVFTQGIKRPEISLFLRLTYLNASILLEGKNSYSLDTLFQSDFSKYSVFELGFAVLLVTKQMLIIENERQKWLDEVNSEIIFRLTTETNDLYEEEDFKNAIVLDVALGYLKFKKPLPIFRTACKYFARVRTRYGAVEISMAYRERV